MSVTESWDRIATWLGANAPATAAKLDPAAEVAELRTAESHFPVPWPEDLREWYGLHNGESNHDQLPGVLPHWNIYSLREAVDSSRFLNTLADDPTTEPSLAGEIAWEFLPEFVPIASNGSGGILFVDLRSGPQHGCVTAYLHGDADTAGPLWSSVNATLLDVARSLEDSTPCAGWLPVVENGALAWIPD